MKTSTKSAFSLVEMLIVLGIIAVLAGVLLSQFGGATDSARATQCATNLRNLVTAAQSYAMQQDDGYYPAAQSFIYKVPDHKKNKLVERKRVGWISGREENEIMNITPVPFNSADEEALRYAITNGAAGVMWQAMGATRTAYQCPIHAEAFRKKNGRRPGWSYMMNREFGMTDTSNKNQSWWGLKMTGSYSFDNRSRSPDKVLMFAEYQAITINDSGDSVSLDAKLDASGTEADSVLDYKNGEVIGFNHRVDKRHYAAHVAFTDGHVEKLHKPTSGGISLKDLTKYLCRGHEVTFRNGSYADADNQ